MVSLLEQFHGPWRARGRAPDDGLGFVKVRTARMMAPLRARNDALFFPSGGAPRSARARVPAPPPRSPRPRPRRSFPMPQASPLALRPQKYAPASGEADDASDDEIFEDASDDVVSSRLERGGGGGGDDASSAGSLPPDARVRPFVRRVARPLAGGASSRRLGRLLGRVASR